MKEKLRCGETHYGDSPYRSDVHGILLHGRRGRLLSVLYTAGGEGLHPTVLLLHGIPGCEKNIDLAQDLRRALRQSRCCLSFLQFPYKNIELIITFIQNEIKVKKCTFFVVYRTY